MSAVTSTVVTPRFVLGIPHTPWRPERVESLARLQEALFQSVDSADIVARVFGERLPNHEWSLRMWTWALEAAEKHGATHFVTLQDDARVCPNFWACLENMVRAVPDQVIGLEVVHPLAPALAADGERWFTTSDGLIGVGYVVPIHVLRRFLSWRASHIALRHLPDLTEDTLLGMFCLATDQRVWHPLPTIIDHDTELPSTYGNDAHVNRRPMVRWDTVQNFTPDWGLESYPPAHLGRFYDATPALCLEHVLGFTGDDYIKAMADNGRKVKRQIAYRVRSAVLQEPQASIVICIPSRGHVTDATMQSVWRLVHETDALVQGEWELNCSWTRTSNLVVTRSRFVRAFLQVPEATHLLFIDDDIAFDPIAIRGMLASGHDMVGCPYPRRDTIQWGRVAAQEDPLGRPPGEARAYLNVMKLIPEQKEIKIERNCIEVAGLGLGCMLIKRHVLETMAEEYRALTFDDDEIPGKKIPTVALFSLLHEGRQLMSEDYSFCERWRRLDGKVHAYLGAGSPVSHSGQHLYRGMIESLGLRRQ